MRERKQCFSAQKVMFYDSQSVGLSLTTDYTDFHRVFLFCLADEFYSPQITQIDTDFSMNLADGFSYLSKW